MACDRSVVSAGGRRGSGECTSQESQSDQQEGVEQGGELTYDDV